ncbi:MAG TPA: chorismate mutase, partial [Balneolales bacterium]|nr:chorismate mutase [Balneolales bacterium]
MTTSEHHLSGSRKRIDEIDQKILELLQQRNETVRDVIETKIQNKLPIFVANREEDKVQRFRGQAGQHGIDADWAEDFLRMIMSSSRASQSSGRFPQ